MKPRGKPTRLRPQTGRRPHAKPPHRRRPTAGDTRLGGTGFFRLAQADGGRWRFVTPAGQAFLSFGLNHVEPGFLLRPYNVRQWKAAFGSADPHAPTFRAAFHRKARADLAAFGFNTLGCHSSTRFYECTWCPYVHTLRFVDVCHWQHPTAGHFPDVFGPAFARHCAALAGAQAGPRRDDAFLLGYAFTDCPILTDHDAAPRGVCIYGDARPGLPTWPRVLRNLGPDSPGKAAYVETMRHLYRGDIRAFNRSYGARFPSFEALSEAVDWRPEVDPGNPREPSDNLVFLQRIVDRYYATAAGAVRRADPNHLIFGDKLNLNTGVPIDIVRTVARHTDLLFFQHYGYYEHQAPVLDAWHGATGKPLLNGDSAFSVPDANMPRPLGPHLAGQAERAHAFTDYAMAAFARPDFVGWHWCGWVDSWEVCQPRRQHSGVQTAFGEPYAPLQAAMREFRGRLCAPA